MSNNIHVNTPADLAKIGNFTKKVDKNLNNKNNK